MKLLSKAIFPFLSGSTNVGIPKYDPSELTGGILHVGVGNFHRAHMAEYMDDLFDSDFENHRDWGIVGAGLYSARKREVLEKQDWLQTIIKRDAESVSARVIGSMIDFLPVDNVNKEHKAIRDKLQDPGIKIVSMTVTEGRR